MEARRAHNPKVVGSNPAPAILKEKHKTSNVCKYAQIAQLVEQRTENPRVAGSIPALGIYRKCSPLDFAFPIFFWKNPYTALKKRMDKF